MPTRFEYARIFWSSPPSVGSNQPEQGPSTTVSLPDGSERDYPTRLIALNDLGKDGWELVAVSTPTAVASTLYLKREIVD
jgi:hypothetical protein